MKMTKPKETPIPAFQETKREKRSDPRLGPVSSKITITKPMSAPKPSPAVSSVQPSPAVSNVPPPRLYSFSALPRASTASASTASATALTLSATPTDADKRQTKDSRPTKPLGHLRRIPEESGEEEMDESNLATAMPTARPQTATKQVVQCEVCDELVVPSKLHKCDVENLSRFCGCKFAKYGCIHKAQRGDLVSHFMENSFDHLDLVHKQAIHQEGVIKSKDEIIARQEKTIQLLRKEIDKMKKH